MKKKKKDKRMSLWMFQHTHDPNTLEADSRHQIQDQPSLKNKWDQRWLST